MANLDQVPGFKTTQASVGGIDGGPANHFSEEPAISGDGSVVVFSARVR